MAIRNLAALSLLAVAACAPASGIQSNQPAPGGPLIIETVRPSTGVAGTTVLVSGIGFSGDVRIMFGGAPADEVRVVNEKSVEVVVPAGSGVVDVCISSDDGSWIALAGWSYEGANDGIVAFCFDAPSSEPVTVAGR